MLRMIEKCIAHSDVSPHRLAQLTGLTRLIRVWAGGPAASIPFAQDMAVNVPGLVVHQPKALALPALDIRVQGAGWVVTPDGIFDR
jgi:hypothetical protein